MDLYNAHCTMHLLHCIFTATKEAIKKQTTGQKWWWWWGCCWWWAAKW